MTNDHFGKFNDATEKGGNLKISQEQIDQALEEIYNDPQIMDLSPDSQNLADIIATKVQELILSNTAESCREDVAEEFAQDKFQAIRDQALSHILEASPR